MDKSSEGKIFIVYCYNSNISHSKYIIGVYFNLEEARERQHYFCSQFGHTAKRTSYGVQRSREGHVTFINSLPVGDCKIELFSTGVC